MTEPPEEPQAPAPEAAPEPVAEPGAPAAPPAVEDPPVAFSAAESTPAVPAMPEPAPIPAPPPAEPSRRPLVKRHHGLVRLTHWANAVLLVGMIASGLQIYMAFAHFGPRGCPYYPNPWDGKPFPLSI